MKKTFIIIGIVLAFGLAAIGGFYGGKVYQANQTSQSTSDFFAARGGQLASDGSSQSGGFAPSGNANGQASAGQFPGGTSGVIETIDGEVVTVSTDQGTVTINLSSTTPVQETVTGSLADLQQGMRVRITGQADSNGVITADQVMIMDSSLDGQQPGASGASTPAP